jgi:hypothetical protein
MIESKTRRIYSWISLLSFDVKPFLNLKNKRNWRFSLIFWTALLIRQEIMFPLIELRFEREQATLSLALKTKMTDLRIQISTASSTL